MTSQYQNAGSDQSNRWFDYSLTDFIIHSGCILSRDIFPSGAAAL